MQRVTLKALTIENFKSYKAPITIEFPCKPGLRLLTGRNDVTPRLGANGAGKTSLFDALCFLLFGVSARGVRASELVTWGEKRSTVKGEFLIDDTTISIERTSNPNRILINDRASEQADVERLFNRTRLRFMHSEVFGQKTNLFADLSVPERGALLDEVLDLTLWLRLSERANVKHAEQEKILVNVERDLAAFNARLSVLEDLDSLKTQAISFEEERGRKLDELIQRLAETEAALTTAQAAEWDYDKALLDVPADEVTQHMLNEAQILCANNTSMRAQLLKELQTLQKSHDFYTNNVTCPTCGQAITEQLRSRHARTAVKEIEEIETEITANRTAEDKLKTQAATLQQKFQESRRLRETQIQERARLTAEVSAHTRALQTLEAEIDKVGSQTNNPFLAEIEKREAEAGETKKQIQHKLANKRQAQGLALQYDYWRQAFKRVRLFLVKRILLELEVETANAINALGLIGWSVKYTTEIENKSGTIKPGIHIQVQSPSGEGSWESWSGGEEQRLRICIALGIGALIQRMSGIAFGFEVWDEPSSWLSSEGVEDLMACLKSRAEMMNKAIWSIDHRGPVFSGFSEEWTVVKSDQGSRIEITNRSES